MKRNLDSLESKKSHALWSSRKLLLESLDSFGHRAFHSGCVDNKKKGGVSITWHHAMGSKWHFSCRLVAAKNWNSCQLVAIEVGDTLIISTYTIPGEQFVSEHAAKLYEFMIGLNWQGKWFIAGDFNEEFNASWISTTIALLGGQQCQIA